MTSARRGGGLGLVVEVGAEDLAGTGGRGAGKASATRGRAVEFGADALMVQPVAAAVDPADPRFSRPRLEMDYPRRRSWAPGAVAVIRPSGPSPARAPRRPHRGAGPPPAPRGSRRAGRRRGR